MKAKKKNYGQWISSALYMIIGAVCGVMTMNYFEQLTANGMPLPLRIISGLGLLLTMYLGLIIQIIIHEAGHLVFGLLTGYGFCSFRIFSFMWIKTDGRIRLKRMKLAGTGGQCLMSPPDLHDGRMPVKLYNYGGAILNLISAVIFLIIAALCPEHQFARLCCTLLAVIGTAFALLNGLPLKTNQVNNDGRNAIDLSKDSGACRAFWIQMKVSELTARGVRLKDMPEEWFTVPSDEAMKNGMTAVLGVFACSRLVDEHKFAEAEKLMEHLLSIESGIVGLHRDLLTNDRIFIELTGEARPDVIGRMKTKELEKTLKAMIDNPSVLRTEYAYALLFEKDENNAREILKKFERAAGSYPYPSEIEAEKELIAIASEKSGSK